MRSVVLDVAVRHISAHAPFDGKSRRRSRLWSRREHVAADAAVSSVDAAAATRVATSRRRSVLAGGAVSILSCIDTTLRAHTSRRYRPKGVSGGYSTSARLARFCAPHHTASVRELTPS